MNTENSLYLGGICFITDRKQCSYSCSKMVSIALQAGLRWIQYRDKDMDRRGSFEEALELRKLTRDYKAFLVINDHVDIAAAVDADGVHLGQEDLPLAEARKILGKEKIIGVSTRSEEEAIKAEDDGADYIGFGPLFLTTTKDIGEPIGADMIGNIRDKVKIPVVAIGGISKEHLETVMSCGAQAVAVAAGILKGDIGDNAKGFIQKLQQAE